MARPRSTAARSRRSATRSSKPQRSKPPSTAAAGRAAERRVVWHYRLRGFRVLDTNAWAGGYELDLVVRRGRRVVFVEVKSKDGKRFGHPLEAVDSRKWGRIRRAAEAWLVRHPELAELELRFEVAALRAGRLQRFAATV